MITCRFLSVGLVLLACAAAWAVDQEAKLPASQSISTGDGWVNLSEGSDLKKHWVTEGNWTLADGVFTLTPRPGESGWQRWKSYLWAQKTYSEFEIKFDYKIGKAGNSGFFFRVDDAKKYVEAARYGLEVQIFDSAGSNKLNDHTSGGLIPAVPPTKNAARPVPEWNSFHIIVKNDHLTVFLNGEKVQDQVDLTRGALAQRPKTGAIGFQDEGMPISLRNILVREGPAVIELFNGKDLTGWRYQKGPSFNGKIESDDKRFSAKDGTLIVHPASESNKGIKQLWTEREFPKDFELRLEFRAAVNADSGLFIRGPQLQVRDYLVAGPYKKLTRYKAQDWNEIVVVVKGQVAHCTCNGEVLEAAFKVPPTGGLGLEADRGQMEYRNLRLKELEAK